MKILLASTMAIAALMLSACGSDESDTVESSDEDTVGAQIADDYNRQMQRARDVEIQLQDKMDRVEDALREADSQAAEDP